MAHDSQEKILKSAGAASTRAVLGLRLRQRRRAQSLTQAALAERAGISASYLNLIEHDRRPIGGKVLFRLARALDVSPKELAGETDLHLIDQIKQIAQQTHQWASEQRDAQTGEQKSESGKPKKTPAKTRDMYIESTEWISEFISRFPDFALLIKTLFEQNQSQTQTLNILADRLNSDPFFGEAIHLLLSNITVIRSTAEILNERGDLPKDLADKFLNNLLVESGHLTQTAKEVVNYFDESTRVLHGQQQASIAEQHFIARDFYIDALEKNPNNLKAYIKEQNFTPPQIAQITPALESYAAMARQLPLKDFLPRAESCGFDPLILSQELNAPPHLIMRRLAHLPKKPSNNWPSFGLLECNGAGAVLFRKPLPALALPRFGTACPLWPIYRALGQHMMPIVATLDMPTGERFHTLSLARQTAPASIGMPALCAASMLIVQDTLGVKNLSKNLDGGVRIPAGLNCSLCPRQECTARHVSYILA